MIQVIRLDRLNQLLKDYNKWKNADETFEEFVRITADDGIYLWEYVCKKNLVEISK